MQAGVRYVRPTDNLHIVPHYPMCRGLQEKHTAHCVIELLLQFQARSVFDSREGMQAFEVVQRFQNVVSWFPLIWFYRLSHVCGTCVSNFFKWIGGLKFKYWIHYITRHCVLRFQFIHKMDWKHKKCYEIKTLHTIIHPKTICIKIFKRLQQIHIITIHQWSIDIESIKFFYWFNIMVTNKILNLLFIKNLYINE